jgi:hypothetical protein
MAEDKARKPSLPAGTGSAKVDAFLEKVGSMPARAGAGRGRLAFAMDATASREPSWDRACRIQGEMFEAAAGLGGIEIQLVYYRGFDECKASRWLASAAELHGAMRVVSCVGGETQIERVLRHALSVARASRIDALVFVGDAMEENADTLAGLAGELGLLNVPVFVFHEGGDANAARCFKEIARLSRGAYCPFDASSAGELKALLGAVASYAAGGRKALADYGKKAGGGALLIARQLGG